MQKLSSRFVFAGLGLSIMFDYLFYKKPFGVSFSIWVTLSVLGILTLSWLEKIKPNWQSILLSLTAIGLSCGNFLRLEPFTRFLSTAFAFLLLMILAASYRYGYWIWYRIQDYLLQIIHLIGGAFSRAWILLFPQNNKEVDLSKKPKKSIWPIVRGIGLALPIIFVLAALLASADPIFESGLEGFINFFRIDNLPEYIFRLIYILIFAYFFTGIFIHAIYPKQNIEKPDPLKPWLKPFLGNVETTIVLTSVNLLFALFLTIQFRYFFGGQSNITATGYTYSEYARRGFSELVAVAVISLVLYLAFSTITQRNNASQTKRLTILNILLFSQVLVILISGFQRLALYESAYGYSRLRTYSTIFIPWLAVLIIAVMVLEILRRQGNFALALLLTGIGFVSTLILFNIDGFIANQNINRASISTQEGYALDYDYLSQLSNDIVPVILNAHTTSTGLQKDKLTANLICRWDALKPDKEKPWQGFNISENNAFRLLSADQDSWSQYSLSNDSEFYDKYVTINGHDYYCQLPGFD